jgi:hypothetical protein
MSVDYVIFYFNVIAATSLSSIQYVGAGVRTHDHEMSALTTRQVVAKMLIKNLDRPLHYFFTVLQQTFTLIILCASFKKP